MKKYAKKLCVFVLVAVLLFFSSVHAQAQVNEAASQANAPATAETSARASGAVPSSSTGQSGIIANGGGTLTLKNMQITSTGSTSLKSESESVGYNAGILSKNKSIASIQDSSVSTVGNGAGAAFAYGEGSSIALDDVTIQTNGDNAYGLTAAQGAKLIAIDAGITTAGSNSPSIKTGPEGGEVSGNNLKTATYGIDSPAIYSAGNVTLFNSTLTASQSEAAVMDGPNSLSLTNVFLAGAEGVYMREGAVDASGGTASLNMTGGSLSAQSGPLFYIANPNTQITLKGVALENTGGNNLMAVAAGGTGQQGTDGSSVILTVLDQVLTGNITADKTSSVQVQLENSTFTGALDPDLSAGDMTITLDAGSTWNLTSNAYVSAITDPDASLSNIHGNGFTVYYDPDNPTNSWLNGNTISLSGGGLLTPAKK